MHVLNNNLFMLCLVQETAKVGILRKNDLSRLDTMEKGKERIGENADNIFLQKGMQEKCIDNKFNFIYESLKIYIREYLKRGEQVL